MAEGINPDFVDYLSRSCGLPATVCQRLVQEVLAQYQETLDEFVRRRHKELQTGEGLKNPRIYSQILSEARARRFGAPDLTERQIRRMIYG